MLPHHQHIGESLYSGLIVVTASCSTALNLTIGGFDQMQMFRSVVCAFLNLEDVEGEMEYYRKSIVLM